MKKNIDLLSVLHESMGKLRDYRKTRMFTEVVMFTTLPFGGIRKNYEYYES